MVIVPGWKSDAPGTTPLGRRPLGPNWQESHQVFSPGGDTKQRKPERAPLNGRPRSSLTIKADYKGWGARPGWSGEGYYSNEKELSANRRRNTLKAIPMSEGKERSSSCNTCPLGNQINLPRRCHLGNQTAGDVREVAFSLPVRGRQISPRLVPP